jgi:hypothetical protein
LRTPNPAAVAAVLEEAAAKAAIEGRNVIGEVRLQQIEPPIALKVSDGEPHPACAIPFSLKATPLGSATSVKRAIAAVVVENRRRRIGRT